ncbi:MAG: DUF1254 domain-containing protein [Sphingomonadaceae bacterium]|nr:DUF1254 domain-containing protein [Sphingomonadaceae bacterium]
MNRWIGPFATAAVAGLAAHVYTVQAAPAFIMGRAMDAMEQRGVPLHAFSLAPRTTPQTQTVVRPSPDLAYSVCRYDFDQLDGPLTVRMAAWDNYSSVSFFDGETNNFLTVRGDGKAREVVLHGPAPVSSRAHRSPTTKGLILIRRLAPTQADYDRVTGVSASDLCTADPSPAPPPALEPQP